MAYLAGLATGVWHSLEEIKKLWICDILYEPQMDQQERDRLMANWHKAVQRCRGWAK